MTTSLLNYLFLPESVRFEVGEEAAEEERGFAFLDGVMA